jgi:hypothetical protein
MAKTLEEIEQDLRAVTDQVGRLMDRISQKGFVPAFLCGHSRLYLPGDYVSRWGSLYGIGLGPSPVSEVLDTEYEIPPPEITSATRRIDQIMHPVRSSMAQVDFLLVDPQAFEANKAIIAADDEDMEARAPILRARQLANPRGRLRVMQLKWEGR